MRIESSTFGVGWEAPSAPPPEARALGAPVGLSRVAVEHLPPTCNTGVGSLGWPKLYDAGTDWLTATCKEVTDAVELRARAFELCREFERQGNEWLDRVRVLGYEGFSCGPVYFGERPDGVMFRASSVGSDLGVEATRGLRVKPTRVDLQVTLCFPGDPQYVGLIVADAAAAASEGLAALGRLSWRTRRIDGYGAGDSAIIGSRSSESFGRCYDKHREGLEKYRERVGKFRERPGVYPEGSWRFEVEYKGSQALQVYERVLGGDSFGGAAVANVKKWYDDHGVGVPVAAAAVPPVRTIQHRSDVERSLTWLRDAVQPTVVKLINMGYRDEVLRALGLGQLP